MNSTLATTLCFILPCLMTTSGASLVFFFKNTSKIVKILTLGLAAGIMFSASIWSLLLPAIEYAENSWKNLKILPVAIAFIIGAIFIIILDLSTGNFFEKKQKNGKTFKFFTAITVHNIPEGLSVGFAIGSAIATGTPALSAFMFALGIAIQNLPEGLATALPIYSSTQNKKKAFLLGTASGLVEPIFSLLGFYLATSVTFLLPWLLSFSAGAMIYVIIQELTPEIYYKEKSWGTWAFVLGFLIMMILDLSF